MSKKEPKMEVVTVERRIVLTEKTCPQCNKRFMGMSHQRYCSKQCSNLAAYWRNPDTYRENRIKSYRRKKEQAKAAK